MVNGHEQHGWTTMDKLRHYMGGSCVRQEDVSTDIVLGGSS